MVEQPDLTSVVRALEALSAWARRRNPSRVSASTIAALNTLERSGPLRITDLADREALTQPGTTVLVDRLEADDLAVRSPDPADKRATLVTITDAGRRLLAERRAVVAAELERLDPSFRDALLGAVPAIDALIGGGTRQLDDNEERP